MKAVAFYLFCEMREVRILFACHFIILFDDFIFQTYRVRDVFFEFYFLKTRNLHIRERNHQILNNICFSSIL